MIGVKIVDFNVILNIARPSVTLETVAEQARLLGVDRCDTNVPLNIVIVCWWHLLIELSHKQWAASWNVLLFQIWWDPKVLFLKCRFVPISVGEESSLHATIHLIDYESIEFTVHVDGLVNAIS